MNVFGGEYYLIGMFRRIDKSNIAKEEINAWLNLLFKELLIIWLQALWYRWYYSLKNKKMTISIMIRAYYGRKARFLKRNNSISHSSVCLNFQPWVNGFLSHLSSLTDTNLYFLNCIMTHNAFTNRIYLNWLMNRYIKNLYRFYCVKSWSDKKQ